MSQNPENELIEAIRFHAKDAKDWESVARALKDNLVSYGDPGRFIRRLATKHGIALGDVKPFSQVNLADESRTDEFGPNGEYWKLTALTRKRIETLPDLLAAFDVDEELWQVVKWRGSSQEVGTAPRAQGGTGDWSRQDARFQIHGLRHVSAEFKLRTHIRDARIELEALKGKSENFAPVYGSISYSEDAYTGLMAEITMADHHFKKFAWAPETRHGNYDLKIATRLYHKAVDVLLSRLRPYTIECFAYVIGHDALNSDNKQGFTTAGTPQNDDSRYQKGFAALRDANIRNIDLMRLIAPVKVIVVPGNHDELSSWHMGDSLQSWYRNCPDVEVDNDPTRVKYLRWGNVLLGLTHGDKGKKKDYGLAMAQERKQDWAETTIREWHTGHLHKEQTLETTVDERMGVKVRVLPSLCGTDAWHSENFYIGNIRTTEAFVWDKGEGLIGSARYTPAMEEYA